jgi:LDH2 family malate/lactate/ureidoglycolate dehydrogenase
MARFLPDELTSLAARALARAGARPAMADAAADARGLATHGVSRVPFYAAMLRNGRTDGGAVPKVVREKGRLAPIGGAKGAALALAVEILCGALTGAALGFENDSFFAESGNRPRIGQAFLAIDAGALAGHDVYMERIETLIAAMVREVGVRVPGERRFALVRDALSSGIEIPEALAVGLRQLSEA